MRKLIRFCTMAMILSASSLSANSHAGAGEWEINAQFLLLKPTFDDTYFVIKSPTSTTFPNGEREHNDFHFEPGFRVGAAYSFCDCPRELLVSYTYLEDDHTKTITGTNLWGTLGRPDFTSGFENFAGSAQSKLDFLYQRLDALYAQEIYNCCGLDVYVQAGLEAAYVRLQEDYAYTNVPTIGAPTIGRIDQRSRTSGVGPELGFALDYDFCQSSYGSFSITFLASGSLLASDSSTRGQNTVFDGTVTDTLLNVKDRSTWRVIPALHARAGLNYDVRWSCFDLGLEVGYEFSSYLRALSRAGFPDDVADGLAFTHYYNFDVQGLYVSASFRF